jgi:hypothetical protein
LGLRYELFFLYLPNAVKVKAMAYKRKSKDPASLPQTLECESGLVAGWESVLPPALQKRVLYIFLYIYIFVSLFWCL